MQTWWALYIGCRWLSSWSCFNLSPFTLNVLTSCISKCKMYKSYLVLILSSLHLFQSIMCDSSLPWWVLLLLCTFPGRVMWSPFLRNYRGVRKNIWALHMGQSGRERTRSDVSTAHLEHLLLTLTYRETLHMFVNSVRLCLLWNLSMYMFNFLKI